MIQTIFIENLVLSSIHGLLPHEKDTPQRFSLDIALSRNIRDKRHQAINETVDYRQIKKIAEEVVMGPSRDLMETIVEEIADILEKRYNPESFEVSIKKLDIWGNAIPGVRIRKG
jgi:FolB domain-containing protein